MDSSKIVDFKLVFSVPRIQHLETVRQVWPAKHVPILFVFDRTDYPLEKDVKSFLEALMSIRRLEKLESITPFEETYTYFWVYDSELAGEEMKKEIMKLFIVCVIVKGNSPELPAQYIKYRHRKEHKVLIVCDLDNTLFEPMDDNNFTVIGFFIGWGNFQPAENPFDYTKLSTEISFNNFFAVQRLYRYPEKI